MGTLIQIIIILLAIPVQIVVMLLARRWTENFLEWRTSKKASKFKAELRAMQSEYDRRESLKKTEVVQTFLGDFNVITYPEEK